MTPINLMDGLAKRLQKLLEDYSTEQPSSETPMPIKVYPGYVPKQEDATERNSFVYVLVRQVIDEDGNKKSSAIVEIGFSVYDEDLSDGWRSLFNLVEHVRQDLLKYRFINMKHRLELPMQTDIMDDNNQAWPNWRATITAKYTVGQPEEEGYDYGDFQESQPYEKYEEYKNH